MPGKATRNSIRRNEKLIRLSNPPKEAILLNSFWVLILLNLGTKLYVFYYDLIKFMDQIVCAFNFKDDFISLQTFQERNCRYSFVFRCKKGQLIDKWVSCLFVCHWPHGLILICSTLLILITQCLKRLYFSKKKKD